MCSCAGDAVVYFSTLAGHCREFLWAAYSKVDILNHRFVGKRRACLKSKPAGRVDTPALHALILLPKFLGVDQLHLLDDSCPWLHVRFHVASRHITNWVCMCLPCFRLQLFHGTLSMCGQSC